MLGRCGSLPRNPSAWITGAIWLGQLAELLSSGFKRATLPQYIRRRAIETHPGQPLTSTHSNTHIHICTHQKGPKYLPPTHTDKAIKEDGSQMSPYLSSLSNQLVSNLTMCQPASKIKTSKVASFKNH